MALSRGTRQPGFRRTGQQYADICILVNALAYLTEGPNPQRFKFGPDHYVFGDETGEKIQDVKTAWENAVLKAHGVKPERTVTGGLSAER
jgi:hypothetical protein